MAIEVAQSRELQKPWGVTDPLPWNDTDHAGRSIGEVCFERTDPTASPPALLLKVLLTSHPLSIQVHPGDAFAHSIGLPNGKTKAWYVPSAKPGAAVGVGLKQFITQTQSRQAIDDGSIAELIACAHRGRR
jgi:mannose-6-phosphate isomerase